MDDALRSEYRRLWRRLSKEQRLLLEATGFDQHDPTDAGVPRQHRSATTQGNESGPTYRQQGTYDVDYMQAKSWRLDREEETEVSVRTFTQDDVLDILRRILSVLDNSNDDGVRLHAYCIKTALGMPDLPNMSATAKAHGLTRAAVSGRVKLIQKNLGLPPSMYMKSDHACRKLSVARRRNLP